MASSMLRGAAKFVTIGLSLAACTLAPLSAQGQTYHGRKTWTVKSDKITLLVTPGGGHIASVTLNAGKGTGLNPLWLPPWNSEEPGNWKNTGGYYGDPPGAPLLESIMGHNICLDFFGAPAAAEAAAGIPVHGEAPALKWTPISNSRGKIIYWTHLPRANMDATRTIQVAPGSSAYWITETVTNRASLDRPFGWNQHVTLGPPFLKQGESFYDTNGTWSMVYPKEFSKGERLKRGSEFEWPNAEGAKGGQVNLREYPAGGKNSDFTASLIPADQTWGWFTAVNTKKGVLIGYVWPRSQWPWLANWEENHFRSGKPWLGKGVARGMEFGTTPWPDSRRDAVTAGKLHDTPVYRWISANATQTIGYGAFITAVPAGTTGAKNVTVSGNKIVVQLNGVDKTLSFPVKK